MEKFTTCLVCNSDKLKPYSQVRDYSISKEDFKLVKCEECSFIFTNPRPDITEIGRYYQSEQYVSHSDSKKGLVNSLYHIVRDFTLGKKVKLINRLSPKKSSILDVGCGTGYFLQKCKENGWDIKGTEPDEKARMLAQKLTGNEILESISQLENEKFSIITLWHVLEHIHNLNNDFKKLLHHLEDKGKIVIAVPNCSSYDAAYYKEYWAAWDVPRHIYHFTPSSMKIFLQKHGLILEKTIPMPFDSFYVSMLSEQYKTGKTNLFKSFAVGAISNLKAKQDTYSSIIYIASK